MINEIESIRYQSPIPQTSSFIFTIPFFCLSLFFVLDLKKKTEKRNSSGKKKRRRRRGSRGKKDRKEKKKGKKGKSSNPCVIATFFPHPSKTNHRSKREREKGEKKARITSPSLTGAAKLPFSLFTIIKPRSQFYFF